MNRLKFLLFVLIVAVGLAACGNGNNKAANEPSESAGASSESAGASSEAPSAPAETESAAASPAASPEPATLSVTDSSGTELVFDKTPERVVCLTDMCVDILAELGLKPAAIKDTLATNPEFFGDEAASFPVIGGAWNEPSTEDIAKAQPDLIMGMEATHGGLRDSLKSVAPLYTLNTTSYGESIEHLKNVGKLLGKAAEAEAAAQKLLDKIAAYKAQSPNDKKVALIMGRDANFWLFTENALEASIIKEVTPFPWPEPDGNTNVGYAQYSLEPMLKEAPDVIFVLSMAAFEGESVPLTEQFKSNPLWTNFKAVKDNQVHEMRQFVWTGRGTRSLGILLDELMTKTYPEQFPQPLNS